MKRTTWVLRILVIALSIFGCTGKSVDSGPAIKFLQGIQDSNKNMMYEATNLTTKLVNESRERLIHPDQYKQTDSQRKDSEYALRVSGEIDFFITKLKKMFPKSARFEITKSETKKTTDDTQNAVHFVKIAYSKKEEAMSDKSGKQVREMIIHLQQATRTINGQLTYEFSFNSADFEKIADKNFEVLSYFD